MAQVMSYPCQIHENCELTHVSPKFKQLTDKQVSVIREEYRPELIDLVLDLSHRTGLNELQSRNILSGLIMGLDLKVIREDNGGYRSTECLTLSPTVCFPW